MTARAVLIALLVLAFLGIADSWYLAESAATDTPLICGPGMLEGCNAVAQSPYSKLFGIPLGVYGVLFYGLLFVAAAATFTGQLKHGAKFLLALTAFGALASLVFVFVQVFLIKALCIYCLASAGISFATLLAAWRLVYKPRVVEVVPV
jgi:uncharacterized membrane protein